MQKYIGKSVQEGIAIGRIYLHQNRKYQISSLKTTDIIGEKQRFHEAVELAKKQLDILSAQAKEKAGKEQAAIFDAQKMLLEDEVYLTMSEQWIEDGFCAQYAAERAKEQLESMFSSLEDCYVQERIADIRDISDRILSILEGEPLPFPKMMQPCIVVAEDLTPSETIRFDAGKILAFVTRHGSAHSHVAILAKSMNIPTLVQTQIELSPDLDGEMAAVDGFDGVFFVQPKQEVLTGLWQKKGKWLSDREAMTELKGKENRTKDGRKIEILANISKAEEIEEVLRADAGGIGLFRSEFLYLGRDTAPTEEEQLACYKEVLKKMKGKKVIVRTLDIGADKTETYFRLDKEENPALGYRAIRICLDRPELLQTQLRAIYRASVYGDIAVMFPMIVSLEEIKRIKAIIKEIQQKLTEEGCLLGKVEIGIMIETPAAAVLSDVFAKEVDFFSIGTNDLTQYTLAADRQNPKLEKMYQGCHPAVFRLIELTVKHAHQAEIPVGICGELAADTSMTHCFIEMGVDELSVSPASVLKVRKAVRAL